MPCVSWCGRRGRRRRESCVLVAEVCEGRHAWGYVRGSVCLRLRCRGAAPFLCVELHQVWWSRILKGEPSIDVEGIEDTSPDHAPYGLLRTSSHVR